MEIGGNRHYIHHTPAIHNTQIDLKIVGNFHCVPAKNKYHDWCVGETKDRMAKYCGLSSQNLIVGSVNKPYMSLYSEINNNSEIARNEANKEKVIEDAKVESPEHEFEVHNQDQKPLNNQRTKAESRKADAHKNRDEEKWYNLNEDLETNMDHQFKDSSLSYQKTKVVI